MSSHGLALVGLGDSNGFAAAGREPADGELRQAARQFEGMFISLWLDSARKANQVFAENNFMNSSQLSTQQALLDREMATAMAEGGGIGLADVIVAQLKRAQPTANGADHLTAPRVVDTGASSAGPRDKPGSRSQATSFGNRTRAFDSAREFIDRLQPIVERAVQPLGISPLALLAQAALETGWGSEVITDRFGQLSHNLFGIKAEEDEPDSVSIVSREHVLGQWLDKADRFRAYPDWQAAVADYLELVTGSQRYRDAALRGADESAYFAALQEAGYATDPQYADKLERVLDSIQRLGQPLAR